MGKQTKIFIVSFVLTFVSLSFVQDIACNDVSSNYNLKAVDITASADGFDFSQKSIYNMILIAEIDHPKIVLKQSICETGHFKSNVLKKNNNLFGFHNGKEYLKFDSLFDCCIYYKNWQDRHYGGGDYYLFLDKFKYAADTNYVNTLKKIRINV